MIPLYLKMNAFGPYAGRQVIDFRQLGDHKLFLIYGPTGAGKTTVLDAICYALYGETSGNRRSGAHMRSEYASPEEKTYVLFDFAIGTKRYRIERMPEQQVAKKRGSGLKKSAASAALYSLDEQGETADVIATKKVNDAVEALLGFKAEQFRQVVLLPQGDFRRLLLAGSAERQQIMQTLFHTQRYALLQELAKEKYDGIHSQYELRNEHIAQRLEQLGAADVADLAALEQSAMQEEAQRRQELKTAVLERDACQQEMQQAQVLYSHWKALKENRRQQEQLRQQEEVFQVKRDHVEILRRVQVLAEPCRHLDEILAKGNDARTKGEKAAIQAEQARHRLQAVEQETALLQAQKERYEGDMKQRVLLQHMMEKADQYGELCRTALHLDEQRRQAEDAWQQLQKENALLQAKIDDGRRALTHQAEIAASLEQAKAKFAIGEERLKQEAALEALTQHMAQCRDDYAQAKETYERLAVQARKDQMDYECVQLSFLQGQAALLADSLHDGEPCPVCGATSHPHPAALQHYVPQKEDVDIRRETAAKSDTQRQQAEILQQCKQAELQSFQHQYEELRSRHPFEATAEQWKARLREQKQLVDGLAAQAARAAEIQQEVAKWEQMQQNGMEKEEQARCRADAARLVAMQSQTAKEQAEADVPVAYRNSAVLRRHIAALTDRISAYEDHVKANREASVRAEKDVTRWAEQVQVLQEQVEALRLQYKEQVAIVKDRVKQAGIESIQRCRELQPQVAMIDEEQKQIDAYDRNVQQVQGRIKQEEEAVGSLPEPNIETYQKKLSEKNAQCQHISELCAAAEIRCKEVKEAQKQISHWHGEQAELERQYKAVGSVYELISGQHTGINFERYVLGALLDEVLAAANCRLDLMSRRRYELQRSRSWDDKRVRRIGLDIEVFDNYTGYARPANTLSGGETFLASLALALGLADVVQAYSGGIHLDAIFIDEGFGTLDGETLDFALKALMELRQGGRLVGIISHVPELKDRIAARLAVRKTDRGSIAAFELP